MKNIIRSMVIACVVILTCSGNLFGEAKQAELKFSAPLVIATPYESYLSGIIPFDHPLVGNDFFSTTTVNLDGKDYPVQDFILFPSMALQVEQVEEGTFGDIIGDLLVDVFSLIYGYLGVPLNSEEVKQLFAQGNVDLASIFFPEMTEEQTETLLKNFKPPQVQLVDVRNAAAALAMGAPYADHLPFDFYLYKAQDGAFSSTEGIYSISGNIITEFKFGEDQKLKKKNFNMTAVADVVRDAMPSVMKACVDKEFGDLQVVSKVCFSAIGSEAKQEMVGGLMLGWTKAATTFNNIMFISDSAGDRPVVINSDGSMSDAEVIFYKKGEKDEFLVDKRIVIGFYPVGSAIFEKTKIAVASSDGINIVSPAGDKKVVTVTPPTEDARPAEIAVLDINKDGCDDLGVTFIKLDEGGASGLYLKTLYPSFALLVQAKGGGGCSGEFHQLDYSVPPRNEKSVQISDIAGIEAGGRKFLIVSDFGNYGDDQFYLYAFGEKEGVLDLVPKEISMRIDDVSEGLGIAKMEPDRYGNLGVILGLLPYKEIKKTKLLCGDNLLVSTIVGLLTQGQGMVTSPEGACQENEVQELIEASCDLFKMCTGDKDGDGIGESVPEGFELKQTCLGKYSSRIICDPCPAKACTDNGIEDVTKCSNVSRPDNDANKNGIVDVCEAYKCPADQNKYYSPWMVFPDNDLDGDKIPDHIFHEQDTIWFMWNIPCDDNINVPPEASIEEEDDGLISRFLDILIPSAYAEEAPATSITGANMSAEIKKTAPSKAYQQRSIGNVNLINPASHVVDQLKVVQKRSLIDAGVSKANAEKLSQLKPLEVLKSFSLQPGLLPPPVEGQMKMQQSGGSMMSIEDIGLGGITSGCGLNSDDISGFPPSKAAVLINMTEPIVEETPPEGVLEVTVTSCPHPAMYTYIRQLNDEVRAITGRPVDMFICEFGTYRAIMPVPKQAQSVTTDNKKIGNLYQMVGMPVINFASAATYPSKTLRLAKPLKVLPYGSTASGKSVAKEIMTSVSPEFDFDVLPDNAQVVVSDALDFYQINGVIQVKYVEGTVNAGKFAAKASAPMSGSGTAGLGDASLGDAGVVLGIHEGIFGPDACSWRGPSCPEPVTNIEDRHIDPKAAIEALKQLKQEWDGKGLTKAASADPYEDAYNVSQLYDEWAKRVNWDADKFFLAQYRYPMTKDTGVTINFLGVRPEMAAGGSGCSCRISRFNASSALPMLIMILPVAIFWTVIRMRARRI